MRMPTSGTEGRSAGFTLVELLAVIAILAVAVAAISYGGRSSVDGAQFRALMAGTASAIREVRAEAIRKAEEKIFIIDLAHRRMGNPNGSILAIPAGVGVSAEVAAAEQSRDGSLGIRFYPSGGSSGGTLRFLWRGRSYLIQVNWLTGNIAMDHG